MAEEISAYIKEEEETAKVEVDNRAKNLLTLAIQKYASETTSERTVSVVTSYRWNEGVGIIGREGRNIRTIEALTGVDLIIDDTPEAVVLSGLIQSEEKSRKEPLLRSSRMDVSIQAVSKKWLKEHVLKVDMFIREAGENAVFQTGVGKMHPDLVKLLGSYEF